MKKKNYIFLFIILLIGIGFAYLSTTLSITGKGIFGQNTWEVYFSYVRYFEGREFVTVEPSIYSDITTELNFEVNLPKPGDKSSFFVDVVNDGDLDAMINVITKSNINSDYAEYKVTYFDGVELSKNDLLKAGERDTLLVELSYKMDVDETIVSSDKDPIDITISLEYEQSDNSTHEREYIYRSLEEDDWDTVLKYGRVDAFPYEVGDTKCLSVTDRTSTNNNGCSNGEYKVRLVNTSRPKVCYSQYFSGSACGVVFEFEDIINHQYMNPAGEYEGVNYTGGHNIGGYPNSNVHSYLKNTLYPLLPDYLRQSIRDVRIISGYGKNDANGDSADNNYETNDYLYLLSISELMEDDNDNFLHLYDTAYTYTRQLDYYKKNNVSIHVGNDLLLKKYNNTVEAWWLRDPYGDLNDSFFDVYTDGEWDCHAAHRTLGIAPAFRLGPMDA